MILSMDIDPLGQNLIMGIASNDSIYTLDASSRISTVLLSVDVSVQGIYSVTWSKIVDLSGSTSVVDTYPV